MKTVTICGSMRFQKEMQEIAFLLETKHKMNVLQCVFSMKNEELSPAERASLARAHHRKIEISDAVYVVDLQGYIGSSVSEEIQFAKANGKEIILHSNFSLKMQDAQSEGSDDKSSMQATLLGGKAMEVMMNEMFKSVIDQDPAAVVICDLSHTIVYMNPAAIERYKKRGGKALIGQSLLSCHNEASCAMILKVTDWFRECKENNRIFTYHNSRENKDVYMVALRDEDGNLIGYYEKHEYRSPETANPYDFSKSLG